MCDAIVMVTEERRQTVTPEEVRAVMDRLRAMHHGRMPIELGDPYKVLVATVISQRTRDEQTAIIAERLFRRYPTVEALAHADEREVYDLLQGSQYRDTKAPRLIALAQQLIARYGGKVPDTRDKLLTLPGVGRKTANCVLNYAFGIPALCVDTHVHRIANTLGWVQTRTPEETEKALEKVIPRDLWIDTNRLFVQHGQTCRARGGRACASCAVCTPPSG